LFENNREHAAAVVLVNDNGDIDGKIIGRTGSSSNTEAVTGKDLPKLVVDHPFFMSTQDHKPASEP
jgi:hypothetical protein